MLCWRTEKLTQKGDMGEASKVAVYGHTDQQSTQWARVRTAYFPPPQPLPDIGAAVGTVWSPSSTSSGVDPVALTRVLDAADRFPRMQLDAAMRLSLLDRVDVKFACDLPGVATFMTSIADQFSIVEVAGSISPKYRSVYFDSDDLNLYMDHHNGRRVRHKVRYRTYLNTDTTFFEVKLRRGNDRTAKHRIRVPWIPHEFGPAENELLERYGITIDHARPIVDVEYSRFTLIGENERVTIDRSLTCTSSAAQVCFDEACIIEIKQPRRDYSSPAYRALRNAGFRASSISKYCVGVVATVPGAKANAFKSRLHYLGRLESRKPTCSTN